MAGRYGGGGWDKDEDWNRAGRQRLPSTDSDDEDNFQNNANKQVLDDFESKYGTRNYNTQNTRMSFLQSIKSMKGKEEKPSPEGKVLASMKNLRLGAAKEGKVLASMKNLRLGAAKERIPNLSKGLRKFAIIPLPTECFTGWVSRLTGNIFLGERRGGHIHVVDKDGKLSGSVSVGQEYVDIWSGMEIGDQQQLVSGYNGQNKQHELRWLKLDNNKIIDNTKIDTNNPKYIFQYNDEYVGVFCVVPLRIELYRKSDLTLQKTVLVDIEVLDYTSLFNVIKTGEYFCISDNKVGVVHVVDDTGEHVQTLGERAEKPYLNQPGKLFSPTNIFQDVDDGLLIACEDGSVHRYMDGKWDIAVKTKGLEDWLWRSIVTDNRVYTICKNKLLMHKIRT